MLKYDSMTRKNPKDPGFLTVTGQICGQKGLGRDSFIKIAKYGPRRPNQSGFMPIVASKGGKSDVKLFVCEKNGLKTFRNCRSVSGGGHPLRPWVWVT